MCRQSSTKSRAVVCENHEIIKNLNGKEDVRDECCAMLSVCWFDGVWRGGVVMIFEYF